MQVSIQQAAMNALAGWIGQNLTDVVVEPRWPAPDKIKPAKAITIVTAGPRQNTSILRQLSYANRSPSGATSTWQVSACNQPFQLDIWAQSDVERDDIIARLDTCLNAGESALTGVYDPDPAGDGVLLLVGDGWVGTTADFNFTGPDLDDNADAVNRDLYRATYRGDANFMLTVTANTARQRVIYFLETVSSTDHYDTVQSSYHT